MLTERDKKRYTRQMMIPGWGEEGQQKLKNSTVFVAGAGGLGSPVSYYLAVAGVGKIILCDFDAPELSNLNRQILHSDARIGINKALSGKITLSELNPDIEVIAVTEKIDADSVARLTAGSQIIVDCMDNFPTRFILNQQAAKAGIPMVHGSIYGLEGRVMFIKSPETACLSCLFTEPPPKEVFPVVGVTPGITGCIQAMEVLKYLTGAGENLKNRMLSFDGGDMRFVEFKIARAKDCPVCGTAR